MDRRNSLEVYNENWPLTPRQKILNALRFYTRKNFEQVIGDLFGVSVLFCCMHSHSQGFESYLERKGHFLSFPENLADSKRWYL